MEHLKRTINIRKDIDLEMLVSKLDWFHPSAAAHAKSLSGANHHRSEEKSVCSQSGE